jgi:hypothetical protein
MAKNIILDVIWKDNVDYSIGNPSVIGIVAYKVDHGTWKATMGITRLGWAVKECSTQELREAAKRIVEVGSHLTAEQAHAFSPNLDVATYVS